MGHEIAHAVAKHSVERMSRAVLIQSSVSLIDIFSGGSYLKLIDQLVWILLVM